MAKKTVINRACKNYINSSKDSDILIDAFNRTTSNEYEENTATIEKENKTIDIVDVEEKTVDEPLPGQQSIDDINFDA